MLGHPPLLETLGGVTFHEHRGPVRRQPQVLTEAQHVGTLGVSDWNPLPRLSSPHQGRLHEIQTVLLIKEAQDDLGAPALFQEPPLDIQHISHWMHTR
jgi:hypothetical protein